jgi:hypothetical protein
MYKRGNQLVRYRLTALLIQYILPKRSLFGILGSKLFDYCEITYR